MDKKMIYPTADVEEGAEKKEEFDTVNYRQWSAERVTLYLNKKGVPVGNNLVMHEINGDMLDDLTDDDYRSLGYEVIGHRMKVWKALIDLQNEKRSYKSYFDYIRHRWDISNMRKYYFGEDLTIEEADNVVNSLALVNALILTIPFSVIMGLSSEYWQTLYDTFLTKYAADCPDRHYSYGRNVTLQCLYGCAYASMTTLLVCIFYYILRPKFVYFKEWWRRCKYCIFLIFSGSIISIVFMLTLFGTVAGWFTFLPANICDDLETNSSNYRVGIAFICAVSVFTISLMA